VLKLALHDCLRTDQAEQHRLVQDQMQPGSATGAKSLRAKRFDRAEEAGLPAGEFRALGGDHRAGVFRRPHQPVNRQRLERSHLRCFGLQIQVRSVARRQQVGHLRPPATALTLTRQFDQAAAHLLIGNAVEVKHDHQVTGPGGHLPGLDPGQRRRRHSEDDGHVLQLERLALAQPS
jgi:hypothetical protein